MNSAKPEQNLQKQNQKTGTTAMTGMECLFTEKIQPSMAATADSKKARIVKNGITGDARSQPPSQKQKAARLYREKLGGILMSYSLLKNRAEELEVTANIKALLQWQVMHILEALEEKAKREGLVIRVSHADKLKKEITDEYNARRSDS